MATEQNLYDLVPYPGRSFPSTHPDAMAVLALLHGLKPAAIESCRVLEIGCNEGVNLIPMAYAIPGGQFTGIDLAAQPIVRGQQRVNELGLTNIRLFQADLMDLDETLGEFDYIVAHGVFAWVPKPVQDALLALCSKLLAPHGVAFISYNALPGGHLRNLAAEILSHAKIDHANGDVQLDEALDLLDFVAESRPRDDAARKLLEDFSKKLRTRSQHVIYHDELAPAHRPVSFTQFTEHAAKHGLQHLSESQLPPPTDCSFKPDVIAKVKAFSHGDPIAEEQMFDLVRMRTYRETLLCRAECAVDRDLCVETIQHMRLTTKATRRGSESQDSREYVLPGGITMNSANMPTIVLLDFLIAASPKSVPFSEVMQFLATRSVNLTAETIKLMMQLVVSRFIDLHVWEPPVSEVLAERPLASASALLEAKLGTRVTTLRHENLDFNDAMSRQLFLMLDGSRNRQQLLEQLIATLPDLPAGDVPENIDKELKLLHESALLLGGEYA